MSAQNANLISHIDCPGGGQVWVDGETLYVGHMRNPHGTSIYDVADPRRPRLLSKIDIPDGWHSHKVRVANGIMIVNHERLGTGGPANFAGGIAIYDVARPDAPKLIVKWLTTGRGVHRFSFDGRYAYISPTAEGYVGNIAMILDLADPAKPVEVARWWIPGQWQAGGEPYPWGDGVAPRCHHPLRLADRLYVSYWHHGWFILDIADMARPQLMAHGYTGATSPHPTHTCLPMPTLLKGRRIMLVADEDVAKLRPTSPSFTWLYDLSDEHSPTPISTFQVPGLDLNGAPQPPMTGCHQPSERLGAGTVVPFAWFAQGLRLVDVSDPFVPKEVGHFIPETPPGCERVSSNDVTLDDRGLIYLIDRQRGIDILESSVI